MVQGLFAGHQTRPEIQSLANLKKRLKGLLKSMFFFATFSKAMAFGASLLTLLSEAQVFPRHSGCLLLHRCF